MMRKILYFSALTLLTGVTFSGNAMAQATNTPIFMQRYKQADVTSQVPTIVKPQAKETNNRAPTRARAQRASYQLPEVKNPYKDSNFGKISSEIDYYDQQTGQYYNQYNYMALLAQRGDRQKLQQVGNYLQVNGVFDQNQYQSAIKSASQGNPIPSKLDQSMEKYKTASADTPAQNANPMRAQRPVATTIIRREKESVTPQRLHQGYDEDMEDGAVKTNKPIFLR